MIFNLDSDNVIYDFLTPYATYLKRSKGRAFTAEPFTYELWRDWGITREEFFEVMESNAYTIFSSGLPLPGAVDGVRALVAAGHDVRVVTHKVWPDRPILTNRAQSATIDWYRKQGLLPLVDLVFTAGNKRSYPADVTVDDKPDLAWAQPGAVNLLFDRAYNQDVGPAPEGVGVIRIFGWSGVTRVLQERGMLP